MRNPKGFACHQCAPQEWRRTPDMTGNHELDASVIRTRNADMRDRLTDHLTGNGAYQRRTGYNGTTTR